MKADKMIYYIIRRKKDKLYYGKNYHYHQTGNVKPKHGFGFPPYLFTSLSRVKRAMRENEILNMYELKSLEVFTWSLKSIKKVHVDNIAPVGVKKEENEDV